MSAVLRTAEHLSSVVAHLADARTALAEADGAGELIAALGDVDARAAGDDVARRRLLAELWVAAELADAHGPDMHELLWSVIEQRVELHRSAEVHLPAQGGLLATPALASVLVADGEPDRSAAHALIDAAQMLAEQLAVPQVSMEAGLAAHAQLAALTDEMAAGQHAGLLPAAQQLSVGALIDEWHHRAQVAGSGRAGTSATGLLAERSDPRCSWLAACACALELAERWSGESMIVRVVDRAALRLAASDLVADPGLFDHDGAARNSQRTSRTVATAWLDALSGDDVGELEHQMVCEELTDSAASALLGAACWRR